MHFAIGTKAFGHRQMHPRFLCQLDRPTSLHAPTTLTLGSITFGGGQVLIPPSLPLLSLGSYGADVDLRPAQNLIVRVTVSLDSASQVIRWSFKSLDPITGMATTDPLAGLLAPGQGGSVTFTEAAKTPTTGTQINNQASIIFDTNSAMSTPV
jgi:hypothetical protein